MGKRLLWSFRDKTRRKKFCKRNVLYLIYSSIFTSKHCNIRATLVQRNELTVFIETLKYYFYQLWLYFTSKNSCQGIFWRFWHMQYWAHTPPTCSESKKQHLSSSCNPAVSYMGIHLEILYLRQLPSISSLYIVIFKSFSFGVQRLRKVTTSDKYARMLIF